jgi:hypothetical protein
MQSLWALLGGDHFGHVTLNNLRMMMLAIKGLHVQPDLTFNKDSKDVIHIKGPFE